MKRYILTEEGYKKLQEEIKRTEEELRKVLFAKGEAAEVGGNVWHDNFSFEQLVREEQMLSKKLKELKQKLNNAEIIKMSDLKDTGVARLGSKVIVEYEDGRQREFIISDPEITDPSKGIISYQSPIGKALLGAKEGDEREYIAGGKVFTIKIIKVLPYRKE
jgi:transcription elongation factor GreA